MPTPNHQLAAILEEMADIMQILGTDGFRVNAFKKASRVIADLPEDLAAIGPDPKKLTEIEGIGKGMAERIVEFLKTGKVKEHHELLAKVPPGLPALLAIPGLGPKTVALLWKSAGIDSLDVLKAKLQGDDLVGLPGMGEKKVENLRKSLAFAQSSGGRARIGQAMPVATWFLTKLRAIKAVKKAEYAGSLRRGKETIGDVDLLVCASEKDAPAIAQAFVKLEGVAQILGQGPTKSSIRTADGLQADLRVVPPESFGAALLYFTGSKEHNILLRQRAIDRGLKLNEWGLFKGETSVAGRTEEEVYKALDLDWIPPELREDHGEIALAEKHKLPHLLELSDIHAELHAHTTASDGQLSIRDLAGVAIDRGFHTLAVTDHSKSQVIANGLSEDRLEKHILAVREVAAELKSKINLLAGSEVDILADGKLDYPNSLLKQLDVVIASPHSGLSQDPKKATARLIKAIENPYVTILGHPTGRLVNAREGLNPDIKALIAAAAARSIALELNANSYRLDLRDSHARLALEAGVKIAINTDAHSPADFDQLPFGVLTARRAGAAKEQIINCLPRETLAKWIKSTRQN